MVYEAKLRRKATEWPPFLQRRWVWQHDARRSMAVRHLFARSQQHGRLRDLWVREAFAQGFNVRKGRMDTPGAVVREALAKGLISTVAEERIQGQLKSLATSFLTAQSCGNAMIKPGKGGSIINIASMSSSVVNYPQEQSCYNASKATVIQLTKSLAAAWASYGIRVKSLAAACMFAASIYGSRIDQHPLANVADPSITFLGNGFLYPEPYRPEEWERRMEKSWINTISNSLNGSRCATDQPSVTKSGFYDFVIRHQIKNFPRN
ncbi:hypothetical protein LTR08_008406 [Meristemomyces frigidus]|nr:hypothetical protein LTR08_008406 [Meristemomyces frigidus]